MAVGKRKCKYTGDWIDPKNGIKTPFGFFDSKESAILFAQDKANKARLRQINKDKQSHVKNIKVQKIKDKERLQELKTLSQLAKEAQKEVNRYIRLRDKLKPCVSCGNNRAHKIGMYGHRFDAGHYRSIGSASHLRFNLFNIHRQCVKCNRDLGGNPVPYRIELIKRIGVNMVESLENDNKPRKFTRLYLERVKKIFSKRARFYEKRV